MIWASPQKPNELCETRLVQAILEGRFPIDSNLPAERELAASLGVTRPTLRETLQRLARDGWLEIRHGKPTRVRDYWREGSLGVLAALAGNPGSLPGDFVTHVLAVRSLLAPAYTRLAVERAAPAVANLLEPLQALADDPTAFTAADWTLQVELTRLSGNPVFTLIYNGFAGLYRVMGERYFSYPQNRELSRLFYRELLACASGGDGAGAGEVVERTMQASQRLWDQVQMQ